MSDWLTRAARIACAGALIAATAHGQDLPITHWLIRGPIHTYTGPARVTHDYLGGESAVLPDSGDLVAGGAFLPVAADSLGAIDLLRVFATATDNAAAYAHAYVYAPEDRTVLVYVRKWSQDPALLAKNMVVVLVTESLTELDPKLLRSNAAREIEIVRPDQKERLEYLEAVRGADWYKKMSELPPIRLAELTAGMTRVQLGQILDGADAAGEKITRDQVRRIKKEVIETEGLGLLEYVEPKYDL